MWLNFCLTSFRRIHHCLATVSEVSQWLSCTEQPKQSVLFISRKRRLKSKIAKRCIFWMMLALLWNRRTASYGFQVLQRLESVMKRAREVTIRTECWIFKRPEKSSRLLVSRLRKSARERFQGRFLPKEKL